VTYEDRMSDAIPTAAPEDATYRIDWEVIEQLPEMVTVQIRKTATEESDGVPQIVEGECSVRGEVISSLITANTYVLSTAEKMTTLIALCELAFRHGHGEILEYPILVPDGGIRMLVLKWQRFTRWYLSLATFNFEEMRALLRGLPHRTRAGGLAFLAEIAQVVPHLEKFEDTPHLLLQL
jgi:hypothetical protein